jgi:hypothetical protein
VARRAEGIVLSQRKYVLDLFSETDMLGRKLIISSINVKAKMSVDVREQINRERYERLISRLIYLSHTHLDVICSKRDEPLHV